jgi:hypothetical protein
MPCGLHPPLIVYNIYLKGLRATLLFLLLFLRNLHTRGGVPDHRIRLAFFTNQTIPKSLIDDSCFRHVFKIHGLRRLRLVGDLDRIEQQQRTYATALVLGKDPDGRKMPKDAKR